VDCIGVIPITVYIGGANQHLPVVANPQVQVQGYYRGGIAKFV